jgi:hypothetical protein
MLGSPCATHTPPLCRGHHQCSQAGGENTVLAGWHVATASTLWMRVGQVPLPSAHNNGCMLSVAGTHGHVLVRCASGGVEA